MTGSRLHFRNLENGSDARIEGQPGVTLGFPAISPSGQMLAYRAVVPGPPVQRPLLLTNITGEETRRARDDCGGRPRLWIDEQTLLIETFGSGLNAFLIVEMHDGAERPLLSAATRKVSNPRLSPDGSWLAFDATSPGGLSTVAIAPFRRDPPMPESEWILVSESACHPFGSRDGYRLYYLPTFPNIDIRSRVSARGFDSFTGHVVNEATEVLTLREMIVPAMLHPTAPVGAPDQIVFLRRCRVARNHDRTIGGVKAVGECRHDWWVIHERCRDLDLVVGDDGAALTQFVHAHERLERHAALVGDPDLDVGLVYLEEQAGHALKGRRSPRIDRRT